MYFCDENSGKILRYLEEQLHGRELENFEAHMRSCSSCQEQLYEEQELSRILRRAHPLYSVPAELRAQISDVLAQHSDANRRADSSFKRLLAASKDKLIAAVGSGCGWRIASAAAAIILCFVLIPNGMRRVKAASYEDTAISSYRSYLNGGYPLEIHSSSPEVIAAWFTGRVPFVVRLPTSNSGSGSNLSYLLVGARVVPYKSSHAALITYQTTGEGKISLLVASSQSTEVGGGDEVRAGGLIFHYHKRGELNVITWSNHGLAYALVSDIPGSAKESCMVCHQNMADHGNFASTR
jgi:anti-sigma factor RsiW